MKKKFLISGAAVFLAVCLLTSALFAFADSNGIYFPTTVLNYSGSEVVSYTSFVDSYTTANTSNGGTVRYYSGSNSYFVFPSGTNLTFYSTSPKYIKASNSLPAVGETVSTVNVLLQGTSVGDTFGNNFVIYRYVLPTDYEYYFLTDFLVYYPPLTFWNRIYSTIDGIIASFSGFINGCMSNSVLAVCVIVIPVFTLIVSVLFSVIPHRGRVRSNKTKSRRRR